jgi:hypothetical protein
LAINSTELDNYSYIYKDGFLIESRLKDKNLNLYQKTTNKYELMSGNMANNPNLLAFISEPIYEYLLTKTTTESNFPKLKDKIEEYEYDASNFKINKVTKTIDINGTNKQKEIKSFEYEPIIKAKCNKIALKAETESLDATKLWTKKYVYNNLSAASNYLINLSNITIAKGAGSDESLVTISSYDTDKIHPTEVIAQNKAKTLLVWGYNKTKLILTIENYDASQDNSLISSLVTSLQNYSNTNDETNMIKTMLAIQVKVPDKMVSGTTYKPLIGVSKTLDPQGNTTSFEYDSFGRLEFVKDFNGNIIKEYKFNLRIK